MDIHKKERLSDYAYNEIKERICNGQFPPGSILSIISLSKLFSMSRTPIREALSRLEAEDFIEVKKGIGAVVKGLSSLDIKNLYNLRSAIEILASETAVYNIPQNKLNEIERGFLKLKQEQPHIDVEEYTTLDKNLHKLLVEYCGNGDVCSISRMIDSNVERYQRFTSKDFDNLAERIAQHLIIIQHIREKNVADLAVELKANIDYGKAFLLP